MRRILPGAALLLLLAPAAAWSQSCAISAAGLNFGTSTGALPQPGVTPLTINCTSGQAYDVGLDAGTGAGASVTTRRMTGPSGVGLQYQMFQNAARTTNWGNTPGIDAPAGTGSGTAQTINIFAQAAASQFATPGSYSDVVTATLTSPGIATRTTTFVVTATVQAYCTISANPLDFGTYSGALVAASSLVTVTCTNTTVFNIGLNAGLAAGATVTARQMTGPGGALLSYGLFLDAGRNQNWGNTPGSDTLLSQSGGSALTYGVNGAIPAGQFVRPGPYSDTITATVFY